MGERGDASRPGCRLTAAHRLRCGTALATAPVQGPALTIRGYTRDAILSIIVAAHATACRVGQRPSLAELATPTHPARGCSSVSDRQGCVGWYACAIGSGAVRSGGVQVAVWQSFRADCYLHRYRRGFSLLSVHRVSPRLDDRVRRTGGASGMCGLPPTTTLVLCAWPTSRAVCDHQTQV